MTTYLFVISIGSAQEFISAARRTRDLWFGSHMLSEISKAAAKAIADEGGRLIFPALEKDHQDLTPSYKLSDETMIKAFNVANIVLAELPETIKEPSKVNEKARIAAKNTWRYYADRTREEVEKLDKDALNLKIWTEQVADVDELTFDIMPIYCAWVPLGSDYQAAYMRLMRLLSGRKSIRDFNPQASEHPMVPKSSLDGARDSVLTKNKKIRKKLAIQLRLGEGEQLCAVALTKRLGSGKVPFPSVVRVALDPWIRGAMNSGEDAKKLLKEIESYCQGTNGFSSGTGHLYRNDFGYDGQILYPSRLSKFLSPKSDLKTKVDSDPKIPSPNARKALQKSDSKTKMDSDAYEDNISVEDLEKLSEIKIRVDKLQKSDKGGLDLGEPDPYLAVLVADGDHMGEAIRKIQTTKDHRDFSRNLSKFANAARNIVESNESNNGVLIYSGGDDVLAFLPVDKCLSAARILHDEFGKLNLIRDDSGNAHGGLKLSVGIAIAHAFEPMEDLIKYGRDAEKAAKAPNRNGLAVHLHKRGGGDPICLREQWRDDDHSLDRKLERWAEMHLANVFADKAAYEMRELAEVYRNWNGTSKEELKELIKADAERMLKRKRTGGTEDKGICQKDLDFMLEGLDSYKKMRHLADELILARKLSEVMKIAGRSKKCQEDR